MRGEVDAEARAHDEVDHRHRVQVDVPPRHVAKYPDTRRRDADGDEQTARERRHEDERDGEHGGRGGEQVLPGVWPHGDVLVVEDERRMEHRHVEADVVVGDLSRCQHQMRLLYRRVDVLREHEEPRLLHAAGVALHVHVVLVRFVGEQKPVELRRELVRSEIRVARERPEVARPRYRHVRAVEAVGRLECVYELVDPLPVIGPPQVHLGPDDDVDGRSVLPEVLDLERVELVDVRSVARQFVEGEALVDVEAPPHGARQVEGVDCGEAQLEGARRHEAAERVAEEGHDAEVARVLHLLHLRVRVAARAEETEQQAVFGCNTTEGDMVFTFVHSRTRTYARALCFML